MIEFINTRENRRFGYVYMTKNLINGKMYIGLHRGDSIDVNYAGTGTAIMVAIEKYGRDNFVNGILEWSGNAEDLSILEQLYIEKYNTFKSGYNMTTGGESAYKQSKEVIKRRALKKSKKYFVAMKSVAKYIGSTKGAVVNGIKRHNLVNGYQVFKVNGSVQDKVDAILNHKEIVVQHNQNRDFAHSEESKKRIRATLKAKGHKPSEEHMSKLRQLNIRPVNQYTKDDVFVTSYKSIKNAYTSTGTNRQSLNDCLNGRNKSAGGFIWKYVS